MSSSTESLETIESSSENEKKKKKSIVHSLSIIIERKEYVCYVIRSIQKNIIYVGITNNFTRRLRQHNRVITGGAKKTKDYPYEPICIVTGFKYNQSMVLNFEWKVQHLGVPRKKPRPYLKPILANLEKIIKGKGGSKAKDVTYDWPHFVIHWYINWKIKCVDVTNVRI